MQQLKRLGLLVESQVFYIWMKGTVDLVVRSNAYLCR